MMHKKESVLQTDWGPFFIVCGKKEKKIWPGMSQEALMRLFFEAAHNSSQFWVLISDCDTLQNTAWALQGADARKWRLHPDTNLICVHCSGSMQTHKGNNLKARNDKNFKN